MERNTPNLEKDIKTITGVFHCVLAFLYVAPFRNQSASDATMVENRGQILGGVGEMCESVFHARPRRINLTVRASVYSQWF